jgi:hypothetical protein
MQAFGEGTNAIYNVLTIAILAALVLAGAFLAGAHGRPSQQCAAANEPPTAARTTHPVEPQPER